MRWASLQPGLLRRPCRPRWVWQKPKRERCQRQAKSIRGRYNLWQWRRRQKHERRIAPGEQKGRQSLYVARVCENVKCVGGEREPTQDNMFSAGHETTQGSDFGKGHESTKGSACGAGHESTQSSAFGAGYESTQSSAFGAGARVHPNRPLGSARRERAARRSVGGRYRYLQRSWGLSTPRG